MRNKQSSKVFSKLKKISQNKKSTQLGNNFNAVQSMMTNCTLNAAQKYGQQANYGYRLGADATPTLEGLIVK